MDLPNISRLMVIESACLLLQMYDNVCHVGLTLCVGFGYADLSQTTKRRKYEDYGFTNKSL